MVKKITAFTLVEVMMAMIIMAVVGAATMPIISKAKPRIEQTTVRGQYGCWHDHENNQLCEAYYDERSLRKSHCYDLNLNTNPKPTCKFALDQRPAHFYMIATGAGSTTRKGRIITEYSPTKSDALIIDIARKNGPLNTTIKAEGQSYKKITKSPIDPENGSKIEPLDPDNIKSCRLISAGQDCPNSPGKKQQRCEIAYDGTENKEAKVEIIGCEGLNEFKDYDNKNRIPLKKCTAQIAVSQAMLTRETLAAHSGSTRVPFSCTNEDGHDYKVEFEYYDSSAENEAATIKVGTHNESHFAKIVSLTPAVRKTEIVKCFGGTRGVVSEGYPGGGYKIGDGICKFPNGPGAVNSSGAVLILW